MGARVQRSCRDGAERRRAARGWPGAQLPRGPAETQTQEATPLEFNTSWLFIHRRRSWSAGAQADGGRAGPTGRPCPPRGVRRGAGTTGLCGPEPEAAAAREAPDVGGPAAAAQRFLLLPRKHRADRQDRGAGSHSCHGDSHGDVTSWAGAGSRAEEGPGHSGARLEEEEERGHRPDRSTNLGWGGRAGPVSGSLGAAGSDEGLRVCATS